MRDAARAARIDVIDLGMGNPDGATPKLVVDTLVHAAQHPINHRYSQSRGIPRLREAIVHRYRVDGLLEVQYHERIVSERPVRRYRERMAGTHVERAISLRVQINADAVALAEACLGWHVYVTNQPAEQLSLQQAVLAYREE